MLWGTLKPQCSTLSKIRQATYFNIMCDYCADKTTEFLMQIEWIKSALHVYESLSLHNNLCILVVLWLFTSVCVHMCHMQVHSLWIIKLELSVFTRNTLGGHKCFMNLLCLNIWVLFHSFSITDIWCYQYTNTCFPFISQSVPHLQPCALIVKYNGNVHML